MPARSAAQQKAAAMALAAKRREIDPRVLKGAAWEMFDSMTADQLEHYAATERSDLPEHAEDKRRKH
jgi:hypothetical protein